GYSPFDTFKEYFDRYPHAELLNRVLYFETTCWLPALLHVEDRVSMAVSLESRVPILDPHLVQFAFTLSTRIKMKDGRMKALMRHAFSHQLVPEVCARETKIGFPVPTSRWFQSGLKEQVNGMITAENSLKRGIFKPQALRDLSKGSLSDFDRSIWGILNLELWHKNLLRSS
ncbi:MAG: hypothetical protein HY537_16670, partial [Deltaproteobacteria bacterium]|nr:hypothetical protein [Deltaproteobacteria bacterium]